MTFDHKVVLQADAGELLLVMDRGQIIERGNHNQLLAINGLYAHLYHTQFRRHEISSDLQDEELG